MMKLVGRTKAINSLKTRYCKDNQLDKMAYLSTTKQSENFKRNVLTKCFWSLTNFDYVSDAEPLPTAMLTQAYDKSCSLILQGKTINMELNGTTYHGHVVSLRLRSDVP